ncbi:MAG: dephospho-CoA kinase [Pirellula sp.]|nr:dephospho-CoA kinase [Pirellula sp.]
MTSLLPPTSGSRTKPRIVGLLGGIASGKSLVAAQLVALGAGLLDADAAGHEVLRRPDVREAIRLRWGDGVLDAAGHVVRPALARLVFVDTPQGRADLAHLEQITHPLIGEVLRERATAMAESGTPLLVLDAPVMLKAGWDKLCDHLLFVDAPLEMRRERARSRGWSDSEFAAREARQEPVDEKKRRADFTVDNSGSAGGTNLQITRLWPSLVG